MVDAYGLYYLKQFHGMVEHFHSICIIHFSIITALQFILFSFKSLFALICDGAAHRPDGDPHFKVRPRMAASVGMNNRRC